MAWVDAINGVKAWVITLFKLTLADATVKYWTSFDQEFPYDGDDYVSVADLKHTDIPRSSSSLSGEVTITMPLNDTWLDADDFSNDRLLDNSAIEIRQVDKDTPANTRVIFDGDFAGGKRTGIGIEMRFTDIFSTRKKIIPKHTYSPLCDKRIGSDECGMVILDNDVTTGSVDAATTSTIIKDAGFAQAEDYFTGGYIEMTSGATDKEKKMIIKYEVGVFTLEGALSEAPGIGDTFTAFPHCRKTHTGCNNFAKTGFVSNVATYYGFQYGPREADIYAGM